MSFMGKLETKLNEVNIEKLSVLNGTESVQYQSELLNGFKEDAENFLLCFSYKENYTFQTFAELWRKNKFGDILQGESNTEQLITFLENCFFQLKKYILFSTNKYIQVGAFYMLYAIYFKQTKSGLVKIRWTSDEYTALKKVLEQSKNHTLDFLVIFNKLKEANAFLFVAETRRWGIEPRYYHDEKLLVDNIFCNDVNFTRVRSKIFSQDFFGVESLNATYEEYRKGIDDYLNDNPERRLCSAFQKSTLVETLKLNCEKFESKVEEPVIEKDSNMQHDSDTRKTIKMRAFKNEVSTLKTLKSSMD